MADGISTSMYQTPQAANPLGVALEFAHAQNAMNQARSFEREFRARDALGPMLKASIDKSGNVDTAKLFNMVAGHPDTGWKLPDLVHGFLQNELVSREIAIRDLERAGKAYENLSSVSSGHVAKAIKDAGGDLNNAVLSYEDYTKFVTGGVVNGLWKPQDAVAILGHVPNGDSLADGKARFNAVYGVSQGSERGRGAVAAAQAALGTVPMTPAEKAKLYWGQMAGADIRTGRTMPATAGAQLGMPPEWAGAGGLGGGPAPATPASPAQAPPAATVGGGPAPATPAAAAPTPAQGPMPTALSKTETERQEAFGRYSSALDTGALQAIDRKKTIAQLREEMKSFKPGAGANWLIQAARFAQALGVSDTNVDRIAGGNLGAAAAEDKLFIVNAVGDLRQRLLSTAGEGSAGRLALKEFEVFLDRANPNMVLDPRGIKKMLDYQDRLADDTLYEQQKLSSVRSRFYNEPGAPLPKGLTRIEEWPAYYNQLRQKHGFLKPIKGE